jgi:hypothetical protein
MKRHNKPQDNREFFPLKALTTNACRRKILRDHKHFFFNVIGDIQMKQILRFQHGTLNLLLNLRAIVVLPTGVIDFL